MSQKSCSATGPVSKPSSKQGEEAEKRHSPRGLCLFFMCCVLRAVSFGALSLTLRLSCFASPALSVDTGFFITSSLALHLSRFILCAVSFDALSLHFAFRALPPLRYRSTPDSSSLRLLHFTFRASFLCAVSFGALSLTLRLSASRFPCCTAPWRLTEAPIPQRRCFLRRV